MTVSLTTWSFSYLALNIIKLHSFTMADFAKPECWIILCITNNYELLLYPFGHNGSFTRGEVMSHNAIKYNSFNIKSTFLEQCWVFVATYLSDNNPYCLCSFIMSLFSFSLSKHRHRLNPDFNQDYICFFILSVRSWS